MSGTLKHVAARAEIHSAIEEQRPALNELSPAERRIVQLIASGMSTSGIASELGVSVRTVENHRAHICGKLELQGRESLLRFALTHKSELL